MSQNEFFDELKRLEAGARRVDAATHPHDAYEHQHPAWAPDQSSQLAHRARGSERQRQYPIHQARGTSTLMERPGGFEGHPASRGRRPQAMPGSLFQPGNSGDPSPLDRSTLLTHEPEGQLSNPYAATSATQRLDLTRYTYADQGQLSSPPQHHYEKSSPAYKASQRRGPVALMSQSSMAYPSPYAAPSQDLDQLYEHDQTSDRRQGDSGRRFDEIPRLPVAHTQPQRQTSIHGTTPTVQGIKLISTHELPDRFRAIFQYPLFNAVQSKCFDTIYRTNDNFVLSSPTGSGKTAVLELAICRLLANSNHGSFKIVYQAPTRSLCAERYRDWQAKFAPLDVQCAELTGDTDNAHLRSVQHAGIIITTPEKWDSVTRKWKDHKKLIEMVKLFMVDEVHILKEERGATLEAVVSRMKSVGSDVRFIALSATVPNEDDIATWLGRDSTRPDVPALRGSFGEEFRPVRLQKYIAPYAAPPNDFSFDSTLTTKLPDIIAKYSQRKPIMIFCFTRNACVQTAKALVDWWRSSEPTKRYWTSPKNNIAVLDKDLQGTIGSGVAFHHAGLAAQDRTAVETGYLKGELGVICCTSTLAVGVNLPCHMVIVKGTVAYQPNTPGGCKEYSDLEIMQMLGRAGRPQFDDSAVAVIMCRQQRKAFYESMVNGQEVLESCLHRNLIDHLNTEISLGTITSAIKMRRWLTGTFLYVRLKANPRHYQIEGDAPGRTLEDRLEHICNQGIAALRHHNLVQSDPELRCTEFGDAMARYYVRFDTMKIIMAVPPQPKLSEILSTLSQAVEFKDIRFRAGEKPTYKTLNDNNSLRFRIPVNLDSSSHKVSLVIQSVLAAIELPSEEYKQKAEYASSKAVIFQNAHRLIRCIIDCQIYVKDSVGARHALMLARSMSAQCWDDSPMHMRQLDGIGPVSVRKLTAAGAKSVEDLEALESYQIERILSRNPPFGTEIHQRSKAFPNPHVSLRVVGHPVARKDHGVTLKLKAAVGFQNDDPPEAFQKKPVYVCLLIETSDGHLLHFARIAAKKLGTGQETDFTAELQNADQTIRAYVMCEEIAGTMHHALLRPDIPANLFPSAQSASKTNQRRTQQRQESPRVQASAQASPGLRDEYEDADLGDDDFAQIEEDGFKDIDDFEIEQLEATKTSTKKQKMNDGSAVETSWAPQQLPNGKWTCNHTCKDKTKCKHMCCRDGTDKKPKPPKSKQPASKPEAKLDSNQTQLDVSKLNRPVNYPTAKLPSNGKLVAPSGSGKPKAISSAASGAGPTALESILLRKPPAMQTESADAHLAHNQVEDDIEDDMEIENQLNSITDDLDGADGFKPLSPRLTQHNDPSQPGAAYHGDASRSKTNFQSKHPAPFPATAWTLSDDSSSSLSKKTPPPTAPALPGDLIDSSSQLFVRPAEQARLQVQSRSSVTLQEQADSTEHVTPTQHPSTTGEGNDGPAVKQSDPMSNKHEAKEVVSHVAESRSDAKDDVGKWFLEEFGSELYNYVG